VTISFSPEAEVDFANVVGYLVEHNPAAAAELGRRIFSALDKLVRRDFEGPEQTLKTGDLVRSWPVPPIRIYYQWRADVLWVVRLYHQAQPPIVR
jgi:plasmid stabilization system protein ParE